MSSFYRYCDALTLFPHPKHGPHVDRIAVGDERLTRQECMAKWAERCRAGVEGDASAQEGNGSDKSGDGAASAGTKSAKIASTVDNVDSTDSTD